MFPHVNECFFNGKIPAEIVFDMVYNPLETVLIRRAREQSKIRGPRHRDVCRAGRAAVRNLDGRVRSALRHGKSSSGSFGAK